MANAEMITTTIMMTTKMTITGNNKLPTKNDNSEMYLRVNCDDRRSHDDGDEESVEHSLEIHDSDRLLLVATGLVQSLR